ncbi:MAG: RHS repeat-associated core domain-containing protein [Myxococcales bacterium]
MFTSVLAFVGWSSSTRAQVGGFVDTVPVADGRSAGAAELQWDHRGRLATAGSGLHRGSYGYADGVERVLEEHDGSIAYYIGADFEVHDGIAVTYARAGDRRVARRSKSTLQTGLLEDLVPSFDGDARIDVGDAWVARTQGKETARHLHASARRRLLEGAPQGVFLHQDHLGNASLATSVAGEPMGERAFGANGELSESHGHVDEYGFTSQRHDLGTDLVHFQFRELDPRVGRWMSPDPRLLIDSELCLERPFECANGYQYVLNNPVDAIDPTGEFLFLLFKVEPLGKESILRLSAIAWTNSRNELLGTVTRSPMNGDWFMAHRNEFKPRVRALEDLARDGPTRNGRVPPDRRELANHGLEADYFVVLGGRESEKREEEVIQDLEVLSWDPEEVSEKVMQLLVRHDFVSTPRPKSFSGLPGTSGLYHSLAAHIRGLVPGKQE